MEEILSDIYSEDLEVFTPYSNKPAAKCCIVCGEPETEVEFWFETGAHPWQKCQRCKRCEYTYVLEFKEKYPESKPKYLPKNINKFKKELELIKNLDEFFDEGGQYGIYS